jgi:hypothetical protein
LLPIGKAYNRASSRRKDMRTGERRGEIKAQKQQQECTRILSLKNKTNLYAMCAYLCVNKQKITGIVTNSAEMSY